jgi:glucose/arabinose dehydrogenase
MNKLLFSLVVVVLALLFSTGESVFAEALLPAPNVKHKVKNFSTVVDRPDGSAPKAPTGFKVTRYADGLRNPRWIYVAPNGDVFVAESQSKEKSANRISLFRDTNKDGLPDVHEIFLSNLNQPLGMLILDGWFYVANTDGIWRYPYKIGQSQIEEAGDKIKSLPAGGRHWTRNIITNHNRTKLYVAVGSSSNIGEKGMLNETRRANILEMNPDGSMEKVYASGLRNPVGMGWAPGTKTLWTVVNERDNIGEDLVPDYLTSVKDGGFYGWPYSYFGNHLDPRLKGIGKTLAASAIVPDLALGAHTASLGLAFYEYKNFPKKYQGGAFIGQHGSWNRSELTGYKVVFFPFKDGRTAGEAEDFLTGFIANEAKSEVYGRPVGVATLLDGSLLVADDAANTIWRVSYSAETE